MRNRMIYQATLQTRSKQMGSSLSKDLQKKYFAPEGDLYLKRQELVKPIQDKIYNAVQQLATNNKYAVIFDSSSDLIMLYTNSNLDKSDKILELLGY